MAMIQCQECGREVSSLAANCPNCGAPIREMRKIPVHFSRAKKLLASALSGSVYIDGVRVGTADNGCAFSVMVSPGNHVISTETSVAYGNPSAGKGSTSNIDIPENATAVDVELIAKTDFMTTAIVVGAVKIRQ